jgi:hypothetical protein
MEPGIGGDDDGEVPDDLETLFDRIEAVKKISLAGQLKRLRQESELRSAKPSP